MHLVKVKDFFIGNGQPLSFMSGPCVIESEEHALESAHMLKEIFCALEIPFIYKSSFDKANRSAGSSFRGPGLEKGLYILERVKKELDIPVLTDIHEPEQAEEAAKVCDVLQVPAFLCRQTDLVMAIANSGCVVNVKKGQFMAPWDMGNVIEKIIACDNHNIILTDRGTTFGYNNLVTDFRSIPIMKKFGYPVCFDASHSVQLPGGMGTSSGGQREFIPTLAKSAIAAGCNCIFLEAHPDPKNAKSDKDSVFPISELKRLAHDLKELYEVIQKQNHV